MWPPLVMPLHLGAFENALREREQALALYGLQRDQRDAKVTVRRFLIGPFRRPLLVPTVRLPTVRRVDWLSVLFVARRPAEAPC